MNTLTKPNPVQHKTFSEMFNQFFGELMAIRPAWKQAFPTDDLLKTAKNQWSIALLEARVNQNQLNLALRKLRQTPDDFFPSVGKFLELCKPTAEDFGLPSFEDAYREVCDKCGYVGHIEWSHPAVYHAISQVGLFDFRQMTNERAFEAFKAAYKATVKAVISGQTLPEIPKAIERKEPVKASAEVANKHLANLKAMFCKPTVAPKQQANCLDPLLANEGEAA